MFGLSADCDSDTLVNFVLFLIFSPIEIYLVCLIVFNKILQFLFSDLH